MNVLAQAGISDVTSPPGGDSSTTIWLLGVVVAMLVTVVGYVLRNTQRHTAAAERFTDMLAKGDLLPANTAEREKRILDALTAATKAIDVNAESQKALTEVIKEVVAEHRNTRALMFSERDFREST